MSDQEQENIEQVKKGYEAFSAGDVDTVMSLFDDNIEWVQPGDSAISGTYHGKGELGQFISRLAEKSTTATPRRFLADGDTVVMLGETTADNETSEVAQVFTLRNGKTVRVQGYADTAVMERIFGKKQVATG
jgi:ketosteroid isomerase-like protein